MAKLIFSLQNVKLGFVAEDGKIIEGSPIPTVDKAELTYIGDKSEQFSVDLSAILTSKVVLTGIFYIQWKKHWQLRKQFSLN